MRSGVATWLVLATSAVALSVLPGCREEEQNRTLIIEKGTYQGPADEELTEDERRDLQRRGDHQRF
ncbi:hypothetical protein [Stappia sp.]|uniref:hypothetical protein n=1 Tax=Stappia sp. TaxID=1870903 RepID=UPI0032D94375